MIRHQLKRLVLTLPLPCRQAVVAVREWYQRIKSERWERIAYPNLPYPIRSNAGIRNILIYMITGLYHSGTEKSLQTIANALAAEYHVVFMYGDKQVDPERRAALDPRIKLVPFSYAENEVAVPHLLRGMKPHFKEVLLQEHIDLIITSSAGYAHYPWNVIRDIPIVLVNLFGAPTLQRNVRTISFVSPFTLAHASAWTGARPGSVVNYLPCGQAPADVRELGVRLRANLGIPPEAFVFGRIGRADDGIYDPIGIKAWRRIADQHPDAHLIVKSPPPTLVRFLTEHPTPRVHLLPPSGGEKDVWSFHGALDAMAHFRYDGETGGVAIGESLSIGNPIVTHRSHVWNVHTEYLTPACSRIAGLDDDEAYARYMEEFISIRKDQPAAWAAMQAEAAAIARRNFSSDSFSAFFRALVGNLSRP